MAVRARKPGWGAIEVVPAVVLLSSSSAYGGAERSLLELACELAQHRQWPPCVAGPGDPESGIQSACGEAGLPFSAVPAPDFSRFRKPRHAPRELFNFGLAVRGVHRLVAAWRPRLIHANGTKAAVCALPVARWDRVPLVWHVRDYPRNIGTERIIGEMADAIIVPSAFMRDALRQHRIGSADRVRLVPNGVRKAAPNAAAIEAARRMLAAPPDTPIVAMVAQMAPWKRHDLFLDAIALLRENGGPPFHAVIAGGDLWGNDRHYAGAIMRRARSPGLRGSVTILGGLPDAAGLLACSDIIVLPSDREPFGRVVIEAWHAGKPVVASDLGCPCELIDDGRTGVVFRHGDVGALARAIGRLLADPALCRDLGQNGNSESERFTPARHAASIANVYEELAG